MPIEGFERKFYFAIEYDLLFFFVSSLSAPLKFFLLICMLNKRENHNFKKPKPPTPKFYRPTLPTPATNPCYIRPSRYLAHWFSPYVYILEHPISREFRVKNATVCLHIRFWHFFVAFHIKNCVFIIFISCFDKNQISATEY